MCRQPPAIAQAVQLYASENRDALPSGADGAWVWDIPRQRQMVSCAMAWNAGVFYCPGTSPRFNDQLNYLNPGFSSPWGFKPFGSSAMSPRCLNPDDLDQPEPHHAARAAKAQHHHLPPMVANHDRVLLADATISENTTGTAANPTPAGSFTTVAGGFSVPHISPHLNGNLPLAEISPSKTAMWPEEVYRNEPTRHQGRGFWW